MHFIEYHKITTANIVGRVLRKEELENLILTGKIVSKRARDKQE